MKMAVARESSNCKAASFTELIFPEEPTSEKYF